MDVVPQALADQGPHPLEQFQESAARFFVRNCARSKELEQKDCESKIGEAGSLVFADMSEAVRRS